MTAVWVVGNSGLLGSALQRILQQRDVNIFTLTQRFNWDDKSVLTAQLQAAVKAFAEFVGEGNHWQIYWAAGVGTMGSTQEALTTETQTLSTMLRLIGKESGLLMAHSRFIFASSAGAIYAGATQNIISESTPVSPTTDYAREKLKQEDLISRFALDNDHITVLLARISTLYGPGQASGKRQGLLAHIARCILRNQSIQIYVPFDTIRDYITADDAASMMVASSYALITPGVFTKIIASEKPTTIAEIISVFKRITRRKPRIVVSACQLSSLYTRRIQFHSQAVPIKQKPATSLLVGISQVMAAERSAFTRP